VTGEIAQDFTLTDQNGIKFNLYDNLNRRVLLIFYPKDNTPVCTRQLSDYQSNKKLFDNLDINLAGINIGSIESHSSFAKSCKFDFPILSDPDKNVSSRYKALTLLGNNKRKLILIGTDKRILFEKDILSFRYLSSEKLKGMFEKIS
jgi:thioredoxin-dependent peroxiredoxin